MFSTPFTCCSMGAVTVSSTTSALAPGYDVVTLTVGGVMSGMLDTGNRGIDRTPSSTITMEMTIAKIGRLMNMELKAPMDQLPSLEDVPSAAGPTVGRALVEARASASVWAITGKPGRARSMPLTM